MAQNVDNLNKPHATAKDYDHAFEGLAFPVAIHMIIRHAAERGGIDREVAATLHKLPRGQYESVSQLKSDIHTVYAAEGYPEDAIPV